MRTITCSVTGTLHCRGHSTCCPKQIRGPALKGMKMNGLGVRYFFNLSSRKRSGSNSSAATSKHERKKQVVKMRKLAIRSPQILPAMHQEHRVRSPEENQQHAYHAWGSRYLVPAGMKNGFPEGSRDGQVVALIEELTCFQHNISQGTITLAYRML